VAAGGLAEGIGVAIAPDGRRCRGVAGATGSDCGPAITPPPASKNAGRSSDLAPRSVLLLVRGRGVAYTSYTCAGVCTMTCLVAWVGVDSRSPSSAYIAADSRLTYVGQGAWDRGQKVFACRTAPFLFGYAGPLLPLQVLGAFSQQIDSGLLGSDPAAEEVAMHLAESLRRGWALLPSYEQQHEWDVLFVARVGNGAATKFVGWQVSNVYQHSDPDEPRLAPLKVPERSGVMEPPCGSGVTSFRKHLADWDLSVAGGTSRAVFSAFCDTVRSGEVRDVGGVPQLVGLQREKNGLIFGIVWDGRRYVLGSPVEDYPGLASVHWRDDLLQCCDPITRARQTWAQRQYRPMSMRRPK
jgi:hypothetical protein